MFSVDYNRLKHLNPSSGYRFNLSRPLEPHVIQDHNQVYEQLYPIFWSLIDHNQNQCQKCRDHAIECYNRNFLTQIKDLHLSSKQLYLLAYMTTYFLDLIQAQGTDLNQAYYILSRGHDYTLSFILNDQKSGILFPKQNSHSKVPENYDAYQGYFLSVLYYYLPQLIDINN